MVHLFAALAKIQNSEKACVEPPEYFMEGAHVAKLIGSAENYLQSINNISLPLRFSREEEKLFLTTLIKDYYYWKEKEPFLFLFISATSIIRLEERLAYLTKGVRTITQLMPKTDEMFKDRSLDNPWKYFGAQPVKPERKSEEKESDFAQRLENYQSDLISYNKQLSEIKEWATCGAIDFERYVRSNPRIPLKKNGQLVLEALRVAKKGSEDEMNDLRLRLVMWSMHSPFETDDLSRAVKILCLDPSRLPDPIDLLTASNEDVGLFCNQLNNATYSKITVKEAWQQVTGKNSPPPASESSETAYPIAQGTLFDRKPQKARSKPVPLSVTLNPQQERWEQLKSWKDEVMKEVENPFINGANKELSFAGVDKLLHADEEIYRDSLMHDLELLKEEYQEGRKQNESRVYMTIDQKGCVELQGKVSESLDLLQMEKEALESKIVKMANKRSLDEIKQQRDLARIGGGVQEMISVDDCIECLLSYNSNRFKSKNQNLDDNDITALSNLTLQLEDLKSRIGQLGRILQLSKEIKELPDPANNSRIYLCQKLTAELDERYHFDSFTEEEQMIFRVFCGESQMIPFKKQMAFIKRMLELHETDPKRFRDIIIQLLPGDGKTSVIAALLLYLASRRKGRLALFIVPASLYETVKANLSQSMWKAFHLNIQTVDLNRKDLTPYKLKQTLKILKTGEGC